MAGFNHIIIYPPCGAVALKLVKLSTDNKGESDVSPEISNLAVLVRANSAGRTAVLGELRARPADFGASHAGLDPRNPDAAVALAGGNVMRCRSAP